MNFNAEEHVYSISRVAFFEGWLKHTKNVKARAYMTFFLQNFILDVLESRIASELVTAAEIAVRSAGQRRVANVIRGISEKSIEESRLVPSSYCHTMSQNDDDYTVNDSSVFY